MQVRLYQKGSAPPPSADGFEDISTEHLPAVGDAIQMEGKNSEVDRRCRVVSRLFRSNFGAGGTEVAIEVESLG